VRTAGYAVTL